MAGIAMNAGKVILLNMPATVVNANIEHATTEERCYIAS